MKFEMPKMNVAIFSLENVVTTSNANANITKAQEALATAGVNAENVTTVANATDWIDA